MGSAVALGDGWPSPIPTPTGPFVTRIRGISSSSAASMWRSTWICSVSCSISSAEETEFARA